MNTVKYEWAAESVDSHGDIQDIVYSPLLSDLEPLSHDGCSVEIVLVREEYLESGDYDKQWAYIQNGKRPDVFDGGSKVPARFKKEVHK